MKTTNLSARINQKSRVIVCAFALVFLCVSLPLESQILTGIDIFSADSSGNATGGDIWNARGNDGPVDIFVTDGSPLSGPFLNGPTDASATISIPLAVGAHTYGMVTTGGSTSWNYHGFSLFFDGGLTPNISVYAADQTALGTPPPFNPNGSLTTYDLTGNNPPVTPAANSVSYQTGNLLVTLTGFSWAKPTVYNLDRVNGGLGKGQVGPDGNPDWVGQFTLNIVQVPEPVSGTLLLMGFAGLLFSARRWTSR